MGSLDYLVFQMLSMTGRLVRLSLEKQSNMTTKTIEEDPADVQMNARTSTIQILEQKSNMYTCSQD